MNGLRQLSDYPWKRQYSHDYRNRLDLVRKQQGIRVNRLKSKGNYALLLTFTMHYLHSNSEIK